MAQKKKQPVAAEPETVEDAVIEAVVDQPKDADDADEIGDAGDVSEDAREEISEEEAERNIERLRDAFSALDDDTVRAMVASLTESNRGELADQLQLPRATMHLGSALPGLLRRKLRIATPARLLQAAFTLTDMVNDDTVRALGSRHEDPSRDDVLEVLPAVIDEYGAPLVTAFLAAYASSDAPSRAVCAELLDTDERFAIGEPIADAAATPATAPPKLSKKEQAALDAKREERKAAKAARRAAEQHEREARESAHAARRAAQRRAKRS